MRADGWNFVARDGVWSLSSAEMSVKRQNTGGNGLDGETRLAQGRKWA